MTVYRCDKCGAIVEKISNINRIEQNRKESPIAEYRYMAGWDLCNDCARRLVKWIKNEDEEEDER